MLPRFIVTWRHNDPTFSDPNQYFKYIQSVLFSPKVTINEPSFFQSTSYYTVKVELPMFIVGKSELLLDVKYSWRHPTTLNVYKKATYNESLTLPIDFDAFEKPIENASPDLAIA